MGISGAKEVASRTTLKIRKSSATKAPQYDLPDLRGKQRRDMNYKTLSKREESIDEKL
jgi:hypothetical protein